MQPADDASRSNPDRLVGIDVSRGLAILLMVFSHGLHWLYTGTSHDLIKLYGRLSLGDAAMAIFFTVAGLSLYLSITAHLHRGTGLEELILRYRKRFCQLYFLGFCISLLWSVLQAQALVLLCLASLYLYCLPRFGVGRSRLIILGAVLCSLAAHQLVVAWLDYSPTLAFLRGQFPFFAVLAMGGTGFLAGALVDCRRRNLAFILTGGGLIGAAQWLFVQGYPLQRFDATPSFILFGLGLTLFCTGFFNLGVVRNLFPVRWLACVGRDALFLFLFHYAAFSLPIHALGLHNRFGPLPALSASAFFAAVIIYTAHHRRRSSFSIYRLTDTIFYTARQLALPLLQSSAKKNPSAQH